MKQMFLLFFLFANHHVYSMYDGGDIESIDCPPLDRTNPNNRKKLRELRKLVESLKREGDDEFIKFLCKNAGRRKSLPPFFKIKPSLQNNKE